MSSQVFFDSTLLILLFIASCCDLSQRRIPNALLAAGFGVSLILHLLFAPPLALLSGWLAGAALGLVMFLPLYMARAMAAGDVKLMATVGAFTGPALVFEIGLATYCAGGVLALLIVLCSGRWRVALANVVALLRPALMRLGGLPMANEPMPHPSAGGMPYALAILAGTMLVLYLRHT